MFLAVILPDIFILAYVLPYEAYDWMPGLVGVRDTLFNYAFLSYMNRLNPGVWGRSSVIFVSSF